MGNIYIKLQVTRLQSDLVAKVIGKGLKLWNRKGMIVCAILTRRMHWGNLLGNSGSNSNFPGFPLLKLCKINHRLSKKRIAITYNKIPRFNL